jgi:hypothetical protein
MVACALKEQAKRTPEKNGLLLRNHMMKIGLCAENKGSSVWATLCFRRDRLTGNAPKTMRRIEYFNLDAVISVGYRVNSLRATHFRQWATRTLREHLTQGYTLNRQRLEANARELEAALLLVRKAVHSPNLQIDAGRGLIEIITRYAQTFLLLQRYDEGLLTEPVQLPPAERCQRWTRPAPWWPWAQGQTPSHAGTRYVGQDREAGMTALVRHLRQPQPEAGQGGRDLQGRA